MTSREKKQQDSENPAEKRGSRRRTVCQDGTNRTEYYAKR
jgi:hypothetical protein